MADGSSPGGTPSGGGRSGERLGGGTRVVAGRYRLASVLGRGGMGTVWHAVDEMLHRDVAIKELRLPDHLDDEEREIQQQRTLREARTAARISHENVITIHDVVEDDGIPWIVMELVHADSLADILKSRGTMTPVEAAEVGLKVLNALVAAEQKGVLHRDVKPANILVTVSGRVVLTDFGIATEAGAQTLTATGMLVGSPNFLAPERAQGLRPNLSADLWSLGLVLYMAVEGRNPFDRPTMISTLNSIMLEEHDPPRRAGALLPVIDGLLRKDPVERLPAKEVERLLLGIIRGDLTQANIHAVPPNVPVAPPTHDSTAAVRHTGEDPGTGTVPGPLPGYASDGGPVPGAAMAVPAAHGTAPGVFAAGPPGHPYDSGPGPGPGPRPGSGPGEAPSGYPVAPYGAHPASVPTYPGPPAAGSSTLGYGGAAAPARPSRKPMVLGVVALVIALVAAGVAVTFVLRGDDKKDSADKTGQVGAADPVGGTQGPTAGASGSEGSPGTTTAPPSGSPGGLTPPSGAVTAEPSRIQGYTWTVDPAGFALYVPTGWQRTESGAQIDYKDPRGKTFLRIGTDNGGVHPLDNFRTIDGDFAAKKQNYVRLQLDSYPVSMPGWEAAVWEFTWDGNPFDPQSGILRSSHAIDLGIRTANGNDFSIYVASFGPDWSAAKKVFDTVVTDFRET
ncbi:protein kinase [Yinghuangia sp. ASG 101]|uniref:serine/threonine-protein kinase n=1 Tax=Yinghuangia sp. ASG 101 TaxID=2896848 RepID=UPI001E4677EF|nr:serine/threonine-protein kinase [Yinghuangia sp. ASG 101]UGQ14561.1 protein kinase [Yinghuangia sp. ASG 101]